MNTDTTNTPQPASTPPSQSSSGPLVGIVIVIALLALGAFYFWQQSAQSGTPEMSYIPGDDASSESWVPAGTGSDDAAALEAELEATNMAEFEALMNADANASESSL